MSQADDYPAPSDARLAKQALREQLRLAKRVMSPDERAEQSAQICRRIVESSLWRSSQAILLYSPLTSEVNVNPLIVSGLSGVKIVSLPRFLSKSDRYAPYVIRQSGDVVDGAFGVREPTADCVELQPNQLDLVIVPGVGFDALGARLGRGGGHYDRLLQGLTATICGVCFRQQVLPRVPEEAHDIKMDCIITPEGWLTGGTD